MMYKTATCTNCKQRFNFAVSEVGLQIDADAGKCPFCGKPADLEAVLVDDEKMAIPGSSVEPRPGPTPEQINFWFQLASLGWGCGLEHPFEWIVDYERHLPQFEAYEDVPAKREELWEVAVAVMNEWECRGVGGPAGEPYTVESLQAAVAEWYRTKREAYENYRMSQMENHQRFVRGQNLLADLLGSIKGKHGQEERNEVKRLLEGFHLMADSPQR